MTLPEKHFKETKRLLAKVNVSQISKWLLEQGYFAEQYILPPAFNVEKYNLKKKSLF